jgi:hypothetical protein
LCNLDPLATEKARRNPNRLQTGCGS